MEQSVRKPLEGVTNILRFNWHFYAFSIVLIGVLLIAKTWFSNFYIVLFFKILIALTLLGTVLSLAVSYYVYDVSGLYRLKWLDRLNISPGSTMVNIHAGFDETSTLLATKYPHAALRVFDFYDPSKHTEISIERARKVNPPYPGTEHIETQALPLEPASTDLVFLILAAHEIRNTAERIAFFADLRRSLKANGRIVVVEHLRDIPNFLAYNIGFLHFYATKVWLDTFQGAGLVIDQTMKITPFISVFSLKDHGVTP